MNFTPWLNFKTSYAYRGEHQRQTYHTPAYVADPKAKRDYPYHSETTGYWEEHVWENVLSFNKTFGKHKRQCNGRYFHDCPQIYMEFCWGRR